MKYEMQVKVFNNKTREMEWSSIRPTHGTPYQYDTYQEAYSMLHSCYPDTINDRLRVKEV